MAKVQKFETVELAAAAMGVEINDQTRPFLETFVTKEKGVSANAKKKTLFDEIAAMGVEGLDFDAETMDSLKVRALAFLYNEGDMDAMDAFAGRFNLAVDHETGSIHRVKAAVKAIEDRNAGGKEGTVGWLTIKMLQDEDLADKSVQELVDGFVEFASELGYPDVKPTTAPSIQWYVNYCRKKGIEICERKRAARAAKTAGGTALGAELTLEKALAPRFKKKAEGAADTGTSMDLD